MRKIKEVIVVEGRYDKNTLAQVVDATVVTLGGFAVFNDKEKVAFLRRLAAERGLIVLTDSDGAGFVIRNYLKGALPKEQVKQAYIPDIHGKEKRKAQPGKEGLLGVEGVDDALVLQALRDALGEEALTAMILDLREPYRTPCRLVLLEQHTMAEAAQLCGRPPKTVEAQIYRAKKMLAQQILQRERCGEECVHGTV